MRIDPGLKLDQFCIETKRDQVILQQKGKRLLQTLFQPISSFAAFACKEITQDFNIRQPLRWQFMKKSNTEFKFHQLYTNLKRTHDEMESDYFQCKL